jgi:hypothetical protein
MNSVKTAIAPCTAAGELVERSAMSAVSRSGYSSGQSQFAISEMVCAYEGKI